MIMYYLYTLLGVILVGLSVIKLIKRQHEASFAYGVAGALLGALNVYSYFANY